MEERTPDKSQQEFSVENEQKIFPKWIRPTLEDEGGEIKRTAIDLGIDEQKILEAFTAAGLEEFDDTAWQQLENANSSQPLTIEEVRKILRSREDFADAEQKFTDIEERLTDGQEMWAPVVLLRPGQKPYLIGGNSRLMACRTLHIRPMVLVLRLENE